MKIVPYLLIVALIACKNHSNPESAIQQKQPKTLSPVSLWLTDNEDSLFWAVSQRVKEDTTQNKSPGVLITKEYIFEDGPLKLLTDRIQAEAKCIQVYYRFRPKENPYFEILLSAGRDTSCVKAIDSIFSDIAQLKYFKISKYRSPVPFSIHQNGNLVVNAENLRFKLTPIGNKYDVVLYLKEKTSPETKEELVNMTFGEEILLKKINTVKYQQLSDTIQGLKSIDEIREYFGIEN